MPKRRQERQEYGHAAERPSVDQLLVWRDQFNRATSDFLKIDLETALPFTKIARQTHEPIKRQRNIQNARKGYDTILRLVDRVKLTQRDSEAVGQGLNQLRSELASLGESL